MIGIIFKFGTEIVEARVHGTNVYFRTSIFGSQFMTIEGLYFNKEGVIKEHPDLRDDIEWKTKAIQRFKDKLKELGNENAIVNYLIEDLKKYGYIAFAKQKAGFRVEKLNAN